MRRIAEKRGVSILADSLFGTKPRAEDQKIVERLNLVALLRPMRFQYQRGSADEAEIPPHPKYDQGSPEMQCRDAGQSDRRGAGLCARAL